MRSTEAKLSEADSIAPILIDPGKILLKRSLREHLRELGFRRGSSGELLTQATTKSEIRDLHSAKRKEVLLRLGESVADDWRVFSDNFANGSEIAPSRIQPELEEVVGGSPSSRLFRLASLYWSIPVSQGYGRRIRFLVWDRSNDKLMGLIALGDPVFNLACRDELIGWTADDRKERLVNVMDAYTLGAIPPYNSLLCGKLIACLLKSSEVANHFSKKYANRIGTISGVKRSPQLAAVLTSSALGRSSLYNRLKLNGEQVFESIGYTKGFGHFHIPDNLFLEMRELLLREGHDYAMGHRYGDGPNWRIRVVRECLRSLDLPSSLLRHNICREVFLCKVASNALDYLKFGDRTLEYESLKSVAFIGEAAKERWIKRRATTRPEFSLWRRDQLIRQILHGNSCGGSEISSCH